MNTPTPRTDAAVKLTFAAGHNTVCPNFARTLERELAALTAERDQLRAEFEKLAITTAQAQDRNVSHRLEREKAEAERTDAIYQRACEVEHELRAENATLRAAQKACEACDEPTAFEVRQLRDQLAAAQQREAIAIASWDEERSRALHEGERVVEWRDRAERAEAAETVALTHWNKELKRAMKAEGELSTERARLRQVALDACKSAQTKLLLWYPKGYYVDPNDLGKINEQQVEACVAAIDAAMKGGEK